MTKLRLRSVSDKDEKIKLEWNNHKPFSVMINDDGQGFVNHEIKDEVVVPANGSVTLDVSW